MIGLIVSQDEGILFSFEPSVTDGELKQTPLIYFHLKVILLFEVGFESEAFLSHEGLLAVILGIEQPVKEHGKFGLQIVLLTFVIENSL